jgi:hypothetical protein
MHTVTTIGRDIAKSVFQVRGVDANGVVVGLYRAGNPLTKAEVLKVICNYVLSS